VSLKLPSGKRRRKVRSAHPIVPRGCRNECSRRRGPFSSTQQALSRYWPCIFPETKHLFSAGHGLTCPVVPFVSVRRGPHRVSMAARSGMRPLMTGRL